MCLLVGEDGRVHEVHFTGRACAISQGFARENVLANLGTHDQPQLA